MNAWRIAFGLLMAVSLLVSTGATHASEPQVTKSRKQISQLLAKRIAEGGDEPAAEASDGDSADAEEPKVDPFQVPDTDDVPELLAFLDTMINFTPKSREELLRSRVRLSGAMKEAAEKIVATANEEEKKLPGYKDAVAVMLNFRAQERNLTDAQEAKLLDELKQYLATFAEPSPYAIRAAQLLASKHEYGGSPEQAAEIYREVGSILAKNSDEKLARSGRLMEGAARRMTLVGQPIEVTGTQMNGMPFDIKTLRGKVVLVDFWATWCGPCRAELPNVKNNYTLYHDKGFEVVAISLDRDRDALEKFLLDEQPPWVTLYDGDWKDNQVATYYGVMGIPTVILVGADGKVISTRARGEELTRLLAEQLGPPPEAPAEPAAVGAEATDEADAQR